VSDFRLLTKTRQITEAVGGASAFQAVPSSWGVDVDEAEPRELLQSSVLAGPFRRVVIDSASSIHNTCRRVMGTAPNATTIGPRQSVPLGDSPHSESDTRTALSSHWLLGSVG